MCVLKVNLCGHYMHVTTDTPLVSVMLPTYLRPWNSTLIVGCVPVFCAKYILHVYSMYMYLLYALLVFVVEECHIVTQAYLIVQTVLNRTTLCTCGFRWAAPVLTRKHFRVRTGAARISLTLFAPFVLLLIPQGGTGVAESLAAWSRQVSTLHFITDMFMVSVPDHPPHVYVYICLCRCMCTYILCTRMSFNSI